MNMNMIIIIIVVGFMITYMTFIRVREFTYHMANVCMWCNVHRVFNLYLFVICFFCHLFRFGWRSMGTHNVYDEWIVIRLTTSNGELTITKSHGLPPPPPSSTSLSSSTGSTHHSQSSHHSLSHQQPNYSKGIFLIRFWTKIFPFSGVCNKIIFVSLLLWPINLIWISCFHSHA